MGDGPQEQPTKKQKSARTREAQAAEIDLEISNALKNLTNTMAVVQHEFRQHRKVAEKTQKASQKVANILRSWLHHEGIEPLQEEEEELQEEEEE